MPESIGHEGFFEKLKGDLTIWPRWNQPGNLVRIMLFEPGYHLMVLIRLGEVVACIPVAGSFLRRILWMIGRIWTACDISPGAKIAPGLYLPHATGIVIGSGATIGRNVTILQGVTIGRNRTTDIEDVRVGDGAAIYAGAKVLGNLRIGKNAKVGANAVLMDLDVPDNMAAVGIPARIVGKPVKNTVKETKKGR